MKIIKYKKKRNGKYLISFDNNQELELYEEVILNNELLLKKDISLVVINNIVKEQAFYACYYEALRLIRVKPRSIYEIRNKLIKSDYNNLDVDGVIKKLVEQGYLNDKLYATSYINNKIITTSHGPKRIISELKSRGVSGEVISEVIKLYDHDVEKEKISKIIDKMIKSNRNKSNNYLKLKIYNDLNREGFTRSIIDEVLSNKSFLDDVNIRNREYEKIKLKLSKKYEGRELEYKIKENLARKGFY